MCLYIKEQYGYLSTAVFFKNRFNVRLNENNNEICIEIAFNIKSDFLLGVYTI